MLTGKIITLAITSFILFSSASFLTESVIGAPGATVPVTPDLHSLTAGNPAYFTVYSNPQSSSSPLLEYTLRNMGVAWHNTGSLWTFTVPGDMAKKVIPQLNVLANISGIRYFETGRSLVSYPSVQFLNYTPSQGVPFAYVPSQISTAYNFTWPLSHGTNGKGQTIVIVDAYGDPNIAYDLKAFDAVSGLPAVNLSVEYPLGRPSSGNLTWAIETSTDVEWAHALAPGAKIVLLVSPSALTDQLQAVVSYAVNNNVGNIISLSWGSPESSMKKAIPAYSEIYREASLKNITVFAASGDSGAYDGTSGLTVNFPASDPYVTGVGGTSLYFSNGQVRQTAWGGNYSGQTFGSGGGYSGYFHAPYWQSAPGFGSVMRGIPDVSLVADQYTGMLVISGGAQYKVGGTSISTPIWADVAALVKERSGTNFGMINPLLYQLAGSRFYNSTFTQILTGTNGYYHAGPGWNPVTGLGTPDVSSLVNYSGNLIRGYGGFALMNGSTNYNATGMNAHLNVKLQPGQIQSNGTTTYYIGLYSNSSNFMRFGVSVTNSSQYLSFYVRQGDNRLRMNYTYPVSRSNDTLSLDFSFNYSHGNNITISSGAFHDSYHVLLGFGGSASPYAGVQQTGSLTNSTVIGTGNFSRISFYTNGTAEGAGSILYEPYSHLGAYRYSTIDSTFNNGNLTFYTGPYTSQKYLNGSAPASPLILFNETFQNPINATFSLSNGEHASWTVGGTKLNGNSKPFDSNGYYNVTARISPSTAINRTIYIPGMRNLNLSVNTGLSFYKNASSEILVDWLNPFRSQQQNIVVPILNDSNNIQVMAHGFRDQQNNVSANSITVDLVPNPVNISFFVFPGSSSVSINKSVIAQSGGWHFSMVMPSDNINVSISSRGYKDFNETLTVYPGSGISRQVELTPASLSEVSLSGNVSDALYSFVIPDANVSTGDGLYSYTNSSGYYIIYSEKGGHNVTGNATLYNSYNSQVNLSANSTLDILLKPARVAINTTDLIQISGYFPLLFYFGYLSWTQYSGNSFYSYSVYVSDNPDFFSPKVSSYSSQNTTSALLTGLVPGQTYYITVILRLSNDQIYESQVVKISYSNPVYLGANVVRVGGIIFYVALAVKIFGKKKKKYDF